MNEKNLEFLPTILATIGLTIFVLCIFISQVSAFSFLIPNTQEEELKWCIKHKPQFNSSTIPGMVTKHKIELGKVQQKCYTEHWTEYCKVLYPKYCPDKEIKDVR